MKIANARERYVAQSTKASDIARQLAFAGFGIVWVLRGTGIGLAQFPPAAVDASRLFAAALAADLLQYVFASAVWGGLHWYMEPRTDAKKEFFAPVWINLPAL